LLVLFIICIAVICCVVLFRTNKRWWWWYSASVVKSNFGNFEKYKSLCTLLVTPPDASFLPGGSRLRLAERGGGHAAGWRGRENVARAVDGTHLLVRRRAINHAGGIHSVVDDWWGHTHRQPTTTRASLRVAERIYVRDIFSASVRPSCHGYAA